MFRFEYSYYFRSFFEDEGTFGVTAGICREEKYWSYQFDLNVTFREEGLTVEWGKLKL